MSAARLEALKGHVFAPVTALVDERRLRLFNRAIGEAEPPTTAGDAEGRVPVPPTYLFCLEMLDAENPFAFVEEIGVEITQILHAGQDFTYHAPVHVGDTLRFTARLADEFHRKRGQLTFLVQEIEVANQHGCKVADIVRTLVLQHDSLAA